jgi:hypothetical protein
MRGSHTVWQHFAFSGLSSPSESQHSAEPSVITTTAIIADIDGNALALDQLWARPIPRAGNWNCSALG